MKNKRIVVKIGTSSITHSDGTIDRKEMERIVSDIARLLQEGHEIILVTSGAVGTGRSIVTLTNTPDDTAQKQVLAAVGQAALIGEYRALFGSYQVTPAQILVTKEDFRDLEHRENMKRCFDALLNERLLPIVNENDTTAVTELMFTDNDELTALVAILVHADQVIILTSVAGVLDAAGNLIEDIGPDSMSHAIMLVSDTASPGGRGGMKSKLTYAKELIENDIPVVIANARKDNVIYDVALGQPIGTRIDPLVKKKT